MALPEKRQHVMLAKAVKINVLHDHHLVGRRLEQRIVQHLFGIFRVATGKELESFRHASRRAHQSLPIWVLPNQLDLPSY
jgi:hypothetical protein